MRRFRRIMLVALASGILAFLIVPFLIPVGSSGTITAEQAAAPDAQFVTLMGLQVHIETVSYTGDTGTGTGDTDTNGPPTPPLVVLLHGFGASTFSWREVLKPLAQVGDVIAYDRPGFGFTERPLESMDTEWMGTESMGTEWSGLNPYGVPGNLALLDALLTEFGDDREIILVGHSAGGLLAAEFARVNPQKVDQLVLVSPAVYSTGGARGWLAPLLAIPQIDRLGPLAVASIASSGDDILRQSFVDQSVLTDAVFDGYRRPLTIEGWEEALWRVTTAPRDNDLAANLADIGQPMLLITGDADTVVPTADTERLATELRDADGIPAELVVIARAGHLPHEEAAEQFLDAVLTWLTRPVR
jgi:pimeloyl-ACP methyl ester carboxylesterase